MIVERMLRIALLGSSWVMYLLLGLSVVSVGAMIERTLFFRRHRDDIPDLTRRFHDAMASDDLFEADRILAHSRSLEAGVLRAGFRWIEGGSEVVMDVIGSEMEKTRKRLESGMTLLGTLGNNAPFIGLLGTVIGVIEAFHQLSDTSNKGAMGNVMAGIAEALVATGVGLFVAIPAVVAFNIAQKKINDIESNVSSMAKLLSAIVKFREHDARHMPRALREGEKLDERSAFAHVALEVEAPATPRAERSELTDSLSALPAASTTASN